MTRSTRASPRRSTRCSAISSISLRSRWSACGAAIPRTVNHGGGRLNRTVGRVRTSGRLLASQNVPEVGRGERASPNCDGCCPGRPGRDHRGDRRRSEDRAALDQRADPDCPPPVERGETGRRGRGLSVAGSDRRGASPDSKQIRARSAIRPPRRRAGGSLADTVSSRRARDRHPGVRGRVPARAGPGSKTNCWRKRPPPAARFALRSENPTAAASRRAGTTSTSGTASFRAASWLCCTTVP